MAGFPTKFAEAVGLGVPVVTTETSDLKECSAINNIPTTFITNKEDIASFFSKGFDELKSYKKKAADCSRVFDYRKNSHCFCDWLLGLVNRT